MIRSVGLTLGGVGEISTPPAQRIGRSSNPLARQGKIFLVEQ
jgi:hypothetical protein